MATNLYVDAVNGDDTNAGTSPGAAFQRLSAAVASAEYDLNTQNIFLSNNGAHIVHDYIDLRLGGVRQNSSYVLNVQAYDAGGSFEIQYPDGSRYAPAAEINCEDNNAGQDGVFYANSYDGFTFDGLSIHDSVAENVFYEFRYNNFVKNCEIYQIKIDPTRSTGTVWDGFGSATSRVSFYNTYIHDITGTTGSSYTIDGLQGSGFNHFFRNYFHNIQNNTVMKVRQSTQIVNNIFSTCNDGIEITTNIDGVSILNNTFYNMSGYCIYANGGSSEYTNIEGNAVSNAEQFLSLGTTPVKNINFITNNLIYEVGEFIYDNNGVDHPVVPLYSLTGALIDTSPIFIDPTNHDYRIKSTSVGYLSGTVQPPGFTFGGGTFGAAAAYFPDEGGGGGDTTSVEVVTMHIS